MEAEFEDVERDWTQFEACFHEGDSVSDFVAVSHVLLKRPLFRLHEDDQSPQTPDIGDRRIVEIVLQDFWGIEWLKLRL